MVYYHLKQTTKPTILEKPHPKVMNTSDMNIGLLSNFKIGGVVSGPANLSERGCGFQLLDMKISQHGIHLQISREKTQTKTETCLRILFLLLGLPLG